MRILYITLLVFTISQQLPAQFTINRSYDIFGGNDISYEIWVDQAGFTLELSPACTSENASFGCPGLLKTDLSGDSLWTSIFAVGNIVDFVRDQEGFYYSCGQQYVDSLSSYRPFLLKVSPDGDSLWTRHYESPLKDSAIDIDFAPDSNLIVYNLGGIFGEYSIITVQKLDRQNGNIIWEREVDTDFTFPSAGQLAVLENGDIMLAYHYPLDGVDRGYALSKLDAQGNTLWTKNYGDIGSDSYGALISAHPDGGAVACWSKDTFSLEYQVSGSNFFIRRLDDAGQSVWEYIQFHGARRETYGMTVASNGDIILCGRTRSLELGGEAYSWLARISPQGELRWERFYLSPTTTFRATGFQDVTETPDGGLAMCGNILDTIPGDPFSPNANVWLAKVGPDGCLTPGCQDTIIYITSTREAAGGPAGIKEIFFRAFPNPASGPLQVQFYNPVRYRSARLRVFNTQGQQLWQAPLQKGTRELEVPAGQWASGLYLLQYEAEGRVLQVEKVVRE